MARRGGVAWDVMPSCRRDPKVAGSIGHQLDWSATLAACATAAARCGG
jgi:hypothetical protein